MNKTFKKHRYLLATPVATIALSFGGGFTDTDAQAKGGNIFTSFVKSFTKQRNKLARQGLANQQATHMKNWQKTGKLQAPSTYPEIEQQMLQEYQRRTSAATRKMLVKPVLAGAGGLVGAGGVVGVGLYRNDVFDKKQSNEAPKPEQLQARSQIGQPQVDSQAQVIETRPTPEQLAEAKNSLSLQDLLAAK